MGRIEGWIGAGWVKPLACLLVIGASACAPAGDEGTGEDSSGTFAGSGAGSSQPAAGVGSMAGSGSAAGASSVQAGSAGFGGEAGASSVAAGTGAGVNGAPAGAGGGGVAGVEAIAGAGGMGSEPADFDYVGETVSLTESWVIAAGTTARVGPGTTFTASIGVKIEIAGTLIVLGSAEAPVQFLGGGAPRSWEGLVIASGGRLELLHASIAGATHGINAQAGSSYAVERTEIGTSFKVAVLFADGSFDHCKFHASGDDTFSAVNEVSVDDVNGTMTIIDASPTVSHSSFDNSSPLVDMVRIGGNASPVFDHVSITGAHCGFHINGGVNNAPTIRNSVLENMAFGVMAYTSKPTFENTNFVGNASDIGFCFGATADNAPTLSGNFYSAGNVVFDATCFEIGVPDSSPAAAAHADAGPVGL